MEKLQLIWSGETELPAGWELQSHTHDFFHLAYIKRGDIVFTADGVNYHLSEGSMILVPPFTVHGAPKDTHSLCIQYEVFFQILNPELKELFEGQKTLVLQGASYLENQFSYICANFNSTDMLRVSSVNSFLHTILFSFLTEKPNADNHSYVFVDSSGYSPLVQSILCYVEKNYDVKYNLPNLAFSLGFNKNYLCTIFRRETGCTISEYMNYHRLRIILVLLQYTGCNKEVRIYELANQCGFMDPSYFNRVFKKYTGMTPIEFINALSKDSDGPEQSSFKKYYIEHLDLKRYSIQESLEYMRGLKAASEIKEE